MTDRIEVDAVAAAYMLDKRFEEGIAHANQTLRQFVAVVCAEGACSYCMCVGHTNAMHEHAAEHPDEPRQRSHVPVAEVDAMVAAAYEQCAQFCDTQREMLEGSASEKAMGARGILRGMTDIIRGEVPADASAHLDALLTEAYERGVADGGRIVGEDGCTITNQPVLRLLAAAREEGRAMAHAAHEGTYAKLRADERDAIVAQARADEREACAKECREWAENGFVAQGNKYDGAAIWAAEQIEARIRARGSKP